ncbi:Propionyl-CoA:succinate CoA transferase [uncultured Roseburia sp.]|uniref:Acetyl-CoA hydrolase/transferase family protein n=1 Tax=Brotonthovivens ammoniilytica TaxID=2981725 RepID=A0ABT2TJG4_9FIRM|nr:acetyl-CoA hydrolase/transferase C-terminal domain-containing protein [Brotonthovivens ammoniilytica]MCU6762349.1 acetyl-CoA hydrolase/transferase family protein [Brotonthovivens ammoniilytica]SCI68916.1 Propionyl-CoA:succinate CoA transferase [uncultured Roseburia sp.]
MSWKTEYRQKLMSAEEALKKIPPGARIALGHAVGEPGYLVHTLSRHPEWFENTEICHMVSLGENKYCQEGMEPYFRHNSLFASGGTRDAIAFGRADFTPCFFYQIPELFTTTLPLDAALVMVTPPDENGNVNLSVSCDYTKSAIQNAKLVIAQVNDQMPWVYGDNTVSVHEIDCFVEHSAPLPELKPAPLGEVEKAIGKHCASLIQDGDTLQLGIGAIPDAVLLSLKDKKDLGIHSEMFSDGVVELAETGVITNRKKVFHPGKSIVTFLMGTKRLYDYVNHNPDVEMHPVDYVNHPAVVAKNDHIVCINSCVQVDLMGQICSESVGLKQISAVGGQVDFVRGAAMADHGISIIAMPSTAARGTLSKIVPILDTGAAVTTSRCDADYIVTEYGIAHLRGRTLKDRARLLIHISHPDFRPNLIQVFEQRFHCSYQPPESY